jgi:hypothetical protein
MRYFTMTEAAASAGITYRMLHWHLREGNLPQACIPIGQRSPLWTPKKLDALRQWFEQRKIKKETMS